MNEIEIFERSIPKIGYIARTITVGEEFTMVSKFIKHIKNRYKNLTSKKIAIFIEPQLETGYPDIVVVEYFDLKQDIWNEHRKKLTNVDLKILYQIQCQKTASINSLSELLGFNNDEINKSVLRLAQCKLVHLSKTQRYVRNVQLHTYCRINKIVSFEAKIAKWSEAYQQASKNVWFSTESFILMKKSNCNEVFMEKCKEFGIGIILINGKVQNLLKSEKRNFPVSYSSLLFNEWIQRCAHEED